MRKALLILAALAFAPLTLFAARPAAPAEEQAGPVAATLPTDVTTAVVEPQEPSEDAARDEVREAEKDLRRLKRQLREKKRAAQKSGGAVDGWGVSMGVSLLSVWDYDNYLLGGVFPTVSLERSLNERFSLKANYGWNGSDTRDRSGTLWVASVELRNYPFEMGRLRGFFMGPVVQYMETRYTSEVYSYSYYYPYTSSYAYYHDITHAWGVGPLLGYQWVLGQSVILGVQNSYRYNWVEVPKSYARYNYYSGSSSSSGGTYTASSWEFTANVGWAF